MSILFLIKSIIILLIKIFNRHICTFEFLQSKNKNFTEKAFPLNTLVNLLLNIA